MTGLVSLASKCCWSQSVGSYGVTIRVAERQPGGKLHLFWTDGSGKQRKRSLGHRDRQLAINQAEAFVENSRCKARPLPHSPQSGCLSLVEGIRLAFDPATGMYPTITKHAREGRRLAERGAEILGEKLDWSELTPAKVQFLVRVLARQSKDGRGLRAAEYMCDVLYASANWLRGEELIPDRAAKPRPNWKTRLKEEWESITGVSLRMNRPRYSVDEMSALFRALPEADPRLRLLLELAAELRVGQATRARRTDLVLDATGGFGLGRFIVHGRVKKPGEIVDLHPELRAQVDEALSFGYLCAAEDAYRRRLISNYYLFPSGRLVEGRALVECSTGSPIGSTVIHDMFRDLESRAGITHQPGRALYGLRRTASDLAPEFASDPRVLNRLTGHLNTATRERTYQDREHELVGVRAACARREMRRYLSSAQARSTV